MARKTATRREFLETIGLGLATAAGGRLPEGEG